LITTIIEQLAAIYQLWTNVSGGVEHDHECVIRVSRSINLIIRDTDVLCTIVYGSES
jgi:hypothetical protein